MTTKSHCSPSNAVGGGIIGAEWPACTRLRYKRKHKIERAVQKAAACVAKWAKWKRGSIGRRIRHLREADNGHGSNIDESNLNSILNYSIRLKQTEEHVEDQGLIKRSNQPRT